MHFFGRVEMTERARLKTTTVSFFLQKVPVHVPHIIV